MKSRIILFVLTVSLLVPSTLLPAQTPGMRIKPGMGMDPRKSDGQCWKASDLNLSTEQAKTLEVLEQAHLKETRLLRAEIFLKRLELREFLTNPSAKVESIRSKYTELNELQAKLEEKMIDYLIKVRSLLIPEQLNNWCPEQEFPFFRRMMRGMEPMDPRPFRRPPPPEGWKED